MFSHPSNVMLWNCIHHIFTILVIQTQKQYSLTSKLMDRHTYCYIPAHSQVEQAVRFVWTNNVYLPSSCSCKIYYILNFVAIQLGYKLKYKCPCLYNQAPGVSLLTSHLPLSLLFNSYKPLREVIVMQSVLGAQSTDIHLVPIIAQWPGTFLEWDKLPNISMRNEQRRTRTAYPQTAWSRLPR